MNELLFSPLSLSKLLKEKGVKQESMFYWADNEDGQWVLALDFDPNGDNDPIVAFGDMLKDDEEDGGCFSAFTLSELPDVFRQVFGDKKSAFGKQLLSKLHFGYFCEAYFKDPKTAWKNLERTIKLL